MTSADLEDGERVFIDANVFIYRFGGRFVQCRALLERCARGELLGYTASSILAEVLHCLMVAEATGKDWVTAKTAVRRLREKPEWVRQLTQYNEHVRKISQMNLTILSATPDVVSRNETARNREGLLRNDSLVIVFMRDLGLTKLASADRDFERVRGV